MGDDTLNTQLWIEMLEDKGLNISIKIIITVLCLRLRDDHSVF